MLSPYTVLDVTDHRGELTAMMLGDMGADVIKVEPPDGSPSRRLPPFLENAPKPEQSLNFFSYNRNKRGITLDLQAEPGRRALLTLVDKADFFIESAEPGEMASLGLGFAELRHRNPRLVYVPLTAYGQDGPDPGCAPNELALPPLSGPLARRARV